MAPIKKCRHARAGVPCECSWWGDVRVAGKRRWVNLGHDERAAHLELNRLRKDAEQGLIPRRGEGDAFADLAAAWFASAESRLRPSTVRAYRVCLGHATAWFADAAVGTITPAAVAEFEARLLKRGLAPSYVLGVRRVVLRVLGHAVDAGHISQVPSMARYPIRVESEPRFLSPDEMSKVIQEAPARLASFAEFGYLTGLRPGELLALERDDVRGLFCHVRRTLDPATSKSGPPKTRASRRVVDLSHRAARVVAGLGPGRLWPWSYTTIEREWTDTVAKAGVAHCTLHALRHSNVSLRVAAGQDIAYIAAQIGHASAGFTLDVYSHLFPRRPDPAGLDEARERFRH